MKIIATTSTVAAIYAMLITQHIAAAKKYDDNKNTMATMAKNKSRDKASYYGRSKIGQRGRPAKRHYYTKRYIMQQEQEQEQSKSKNVLTATINEAIIPGLQRGDDFTALMSEEMVSVSFGGN